MTEWTDDAGSLLRGLVGKTIPTMTGKPNTILRVEDENVIVATEKSPQGKPVPIKEVQTALDWLHTERVIDIRVESVGYRSAFIGAVLQTLSGTKITLNPPRIILKD